MSNKRLAKKLKEFLEGVKTEEHKYRQLAFFVQGMINKANNHAYARGKFEGLSQ